MAASTRWTAVLLLGPAVLAGCGAGGPRTARTGASGHTTNRTGTAGAPAPGSLAAGTTSSTSSVPGQVGSKPAGSASAPTTAASATPSSNQSTPKPKVDPSALTGTSLAFVSAGGLWEVAGGREVEVAAPTGLVAVHPTFSADGRWLAFLEVPTGTSSAVPELWMSRSDGAGAHQVTSVTDPEYLAWSPSGERLLVATAGANGPAQVLVVQPTGAVSQLGSGLVASAAWSPAGTEVAVSLTNHEATGFTSVIESVPASGGGLPTVWRTNTQDVLEVAGWWSSWGIVYWDDPDGSASIAADGLELDALAGAAQAPHAIADTLVRSDWLSTGPVPEVALVQGDSRLEWEGKSVAMCAPFSCRTVPTARGSVSLDPCLSVQGTLAYVQGPSSQSPDSSPTQVAAWEAGHTLWTESSRSRTVTELAGGRGASAPMWSADGRRLMFVRQDGLWVMPSSGGTGVQVVQGVSVPASYYGQVQWLDQFAWAPAPAP